MRSAAKLFSDRILLTWGIALACTQNLAVASSLLLTGTVVDDASGLPVPNSRGFILRQGGAWTSFQSKDDGAFQVEDAAAGYQTVLVGHQGYLSASISLRPESGTRQALLVRLMRLNAIEGRLTGLRGRSARVLAMTKYVDAGSGAEIWKPVLSTSAICCAATMIRGAPNDDNGDFRIPDLPPGTYALIVSYSDSYADARNPAIHNNLSTGLLRYPEGTDGLEIQAGGSILNVQVPIPTGDGHSIEGHVELPDSGSWYWVTLSAPDHPALAVATTLTDAKGAFGFRDVVPGSYELLAVPGTGARGNRSSEQVIAHAGFSRVDVDINAGDVTGVTMTPRRGTSTSIALQEFPAMRDGRNVCGSAKTTLIPLVDWGINLERSLTQVRVDRAGDPLWPESIDGLAPTKYGLLVQTAPGCLLADNPMIDLSMTSAGSVEGKLKEPGTVRGQIEAPAEQVDAWEVILIPEDFTEGWPVLPVNWFSFRTAFITATGSYGVPSGGKVPYVRISTLDADARFELIDVPAGRYRIAVRPTAPALSGPTLVGWQGMMRIQVAPAATSEIDLAVPDLRLFKAGSDH